MPLVFNTVKEALEFLDGFDGHGMISEDEDLQIERLLENYDLEDDYTPEERKEYEEYLSGYDSKEELQKMHYFELKRLAEKHGY